MGKIGSPEHEAKLDETKNELEEKGWRVIKLFGKSPDAIAVKNGEIIAVEILKTMEKRKDKPKTNQKTWEVYNPGIMGECLRQTKGTTIECLMMWFLVYFIQINK